MEKLDSLLHLWDGWDRFPGGRPFPRKENQDALGKLSESKGLLVKGCRASGKSTLLRLLAMDYLHRGASRESIIFLDLEDPIWSYLPNKNEYLDEILNRRPKLLLLDGLERIENWEPVLFKSIRRGITTIASITGKARPTIKDLGVQELLPMSLSSWISIYTDKKVDSESGRDYLIKYLKAGGLPVTRLAVGRRQALIEVFYSSLLKDVLLRKGVRAPKVLTAMAVYLMKNTGRPVSAARMRGSISRSMDQSRMLLDHLVDSGLVSLVSRLEDANRIANQSARLVFASDTGLAVALWPQLADGKLENLYSLALTATYHHCSRMGQQVWSWRFDKGFGLALGDGGIAYLMIDLQVKEGKADISRLQSAMTRYGCKKGLLLTMDEQGSSSGIKIVPLWKWLMVESTDISNNIEQTVMKVEKSKKSKKLPRHLL